jgi:hypothetical protein
VDSLSKESSFANLNSLDCAIVTSRNNMVDVILARMGGNRDKT